MSHTTEIKAVPIRDINALRAAVNELKAKGINVELVQNENPRMYYSDQLQRHLGTKSETCDYVVKVKDAKYDIGFIKNDDGTYSMVFDDWQKSIKKVLGAEQKNAGRDEHWAGRRDATEQTLHSVGKLTQAYSKHAAINAATTKGYQVTGTHTDADGNIHLEIKQ